MAGGYAQRRGKLSELVGEVPHTGRVLHWAALDPHRFERVVQMLLRDAFGATAIDGAGGDLAQDMRWDSTDGLVIFEAKSFRGRLTAVRSGR